LKLECKIESNFKRVGKRSRNAEMEREIVELRKQIANQQASPSQADASANTPGSSQGTGLYHTSGAVPDQYMGSHEAVASLLDLRSGFDGNYLRSPSGQINVPKKLEDVSITNDRVVEIFNL
jgi:hypothetical protein